jgi:hypothetical protein
MTGFVWVAYQICRVSRPVRADVAFLPRVGWLPRATSGRGGIQIKYSITMSKVEAEPLIFSLSYLVLHHKLYAVRRKTQIEEFDSALTVCALRLAREIVRPSLAADNCDCDSIDADSALVSR